ncbi:hypothetical protein L0Z42_13700 [Burkholderia multivorans]|uniref:hypothetical protein n=1 Tax=Burkholderia multivorans TaxID=87883 RepID=UPI0020188E61|nr:hypothetical protein [Burkholderia multivorans]MCO1371590.1 hypothetical protein [Burkholderia multivorans]MCO1457162.1 hypothetical protein [Burkholderia multivorans]MCO1466148.1 hypothetical protein [Burkholderia multivorans]UQO16153.1 hypothetical protein L0Z02_11145 [Burkholderia multivorans]UQO86478.1 hypothetical protein L0Y86_15305 [Burkholderia multivorans]
MFLFELAIESAMRMGDIYARYHAVRRWSPYGRARADEERSKRSVRLTTVAIAAYERYVAAMTSQEAEMCGFSFDGGRLFPWIDDIEASMYAKNLPLLKRKVLERVIETLSGQFGRLFDAAGCLDLVFHDLRHEATSWLYDRTTLGDIQSRKSPAIRIRRC